MQIKSSQKLYHITVIYSDGKTRTLNIKASSREVAEQRALKRKPHAVAVQRPTN